MTAEELLTAILAVLKDIQRMEKIRFMAQVGETLDMFPEMDPVPDSTTLPPAN